MLFIVVWTMTWINENLHRYIVETNDLVLLHSLIH